MVKINISAAAVGFNSICLIGEWHKEVIGARRVARLKLVDLQATVYAVYFEVKTTIFEGFSRFACAGEHLNDLGAVIVVEFEPESIFQVERVVFETGKFRELRGGNGRTGAGFEHLVFFLAQALIFCKIVVIFVGGVVVFATANYEQEKDEGTDEVFFHFF